MSKFTDNLSEEEFYEEIGEMNHFWKKYSKLPYRILMDYDGKNRKRKNNSPRIMISLDDKLEEIVPISIDRINPTILIELNKNIPDLYLILDWVKENYDILIRHWNQRLDDYIALKLLKRRVLKKGVNNK